MELKEKLSSQRDCCNCSTEEVELTEPLSESSNSLSIPETDCAEGLAPDGGWGWVVCLASFLCNVIVDGIAFSFGVILQEYATYFNSSVSSISLANSLYLGIHAIEGPIVGALINKYGCRAVAITGGVIGTLPFILSTFSPSVIVFQVTYGVLGGIAFGMIYLPTIVGVGLYFRRKRAIATGISVAGTGFGAIIFAPFTEYLLENLGWKGAHIVFAGLMLQCCVFGSLMRPLTARSKGLKASSSTSTLTEQKCFTSQYI
ncbi:hypothetical protein EB796_005387 [Bugula neritina]|uniref:Major facilitator superfamily (MFS) profile domain-containing protein n=1 Tax=Bugula neritina TaxID=10212 RepID=A0A7J7KEM2_BUGNE|nr:hypothetical protein EB796_005387 [Bugula neritina]